METLLLNKKNYESMNCGDGACNGCGEKTAIHLFTATVTALMQPRVKRHLEHLQGLIEQLEKHIRLKLADTMDLSDAAAIERAVAEHQSIDLTLSKLSSALDRGKAGTPLDPAWLKWVTQLLAKLKQLKWQYLEGLTKRGRATLGFINATGCTSVYGSTFPFNPYPFPWSSHLFQDAPSVAMGLFEGHMTKMADGFRAVRMAEMELQGRLDHQAIEDQLRYFNWMQFSEQEFLLCPPVVAVGGDGAMYDIGFQNLSRALISGMPIKVLVLDTQVYSNTGGQACTSGFIGQVSDMAPFGPAWRGKEETRKEMGLIGMAHRTTYVLQGSSSNYTHLIEGYIEGLNARRPALFNIYAPCQPEHGIADDAAEMQSKLAVESRAYPLMKFDPDAGETWEECLDLEGNPALDEDWPVYKLEYEDEEGTRESMELPMTFADFAITEGRFRKHFRMAPRDTWNEHMLPLTEFIALEKQDREGMYPYIWAVDRKNHLMRVICSAEIVTSTEERRSHWRLIKSIAGIARAVDPEKIANDVRTDIARELSAGLFSLVAGGAGSDLAAKFSATLAAAPSAAAPSLNAPGSAAGGAAAGSNGYEPVWIETPECTTCDECVEINPKIFAYNDKKLAYVVDPKGGPFKDIVRAAEKCTARCIHPGTPWNPSEKDVSKLIKRAEKYQ